MGSNKRTNNWWSRLGISGLTRYLDEVETKEKNQKREEEEAILAKKREEELQFEKLKFEHKSNMQSLDQPTAKPPRKGNVKMPKLVITKYERHLWKMALLLE